MTQSTLMCLVSLLWTSLAVGCAMAPQALPVAHRAALQSAESAPDTCGELVYEGKVYDADDEGATLEFTYERRVRTLEDQRTLSTHITHDTSGKVVITEAVTHNAGYQLTHFEALNDQTGTHGVAQYDERSNTLTLTLTEADGEVTQRTEHPDAPVVAGPSLFGFIIMRGEELDAGRPVSVRMIAMSRVETIGFTIRLAQRANGQALYTIAPSRALIRMVVPTFELVIDEQSHDIVRYMGFIPPMREASGKLKSFTGRVEYTPQNGRYR